MRHAWAGRLMVTTVVFALGCEAFITERTYQAAAGGADAVVGGGGDAGDDAMGGGGSTGSSQGGRSACDGDFDFRTYRQGAIPDACWLESEAAAGSIVDGQGYEMQPLEGDIWFRVKADTQTAPLLYQEVDGPFGILAELSVHRQGVPSSLLQGLANGAGIIVFAPGPTPLDHDWLLADFGRQTEVDHGSQHGYVTWRVSTSTPASGSSATTVQLRLCRAEGRVRISSNDAIPGSPQFDQAFNMREDDLQVGFTAHANDGTETVQATFHRVKIGRGYATLAACESDLLFYPEE